MKTQVSVWLQDKGEILSIKPVNKITNEKPDRSTFNIFDSENMTMD